MKKREKNIRVFLGIILLIVSGGGIVWYASEGRGDTIKLIVLLGIYFIGAISVCLNCIDS